MPGYPHIERYYQDKQRLIDYGGSSNEQSIRAAFQNCLATYCRAHREDLELVPELRTRKGVVPDGTVNDRFRLAHGYWEAKDLHDNLDAEIQNKLRRGYPDDNILFENSRTAVLIQHGEVARRANMDRPAELHRIITSFLDYVTREVEEFRKGWQQFKKDLPDILAALRDAVRSAAERDDYRAAAASFLELCHRTISREVSELDVQEMLIQHILTKDIFLRVFSEDQFHQENNIAPATGRPGPDLLYRNPASRNRRRTAALLRGHHRGSRQYRRLPRKTAVPKGHLRGLLQGIQPGCRRPPGRGIHPRRGGGFHHPRC